MSPGHDADAPDGAAAARPAPAGEGAADPSLDLGSVWGALDNLPRAAASPTLTATTVEMAAVGVRAGGEMAGRGTTRGWILPAGAILGGLLAGLILGRASAPDPDQRSLEYLPVIKHIGALREAGSMEFLAEVATRDYPVPRRFGMFGGRPGEGRGGEGAGEPAGNSEGEGPEIPVPAAWEAAVRELAGEPLGKDTTADVLARRRGDVEALPADARRELSDRASEFLGLSEVARHDVLELARFLAASGDDRAAERERLENAVAVWHQYLALRDPAERDDVVDLSKEERLESLGRFYARFPFRGQREWDPRRGSGGPRPDGAPRGSDGSPRGGPDGPSRPPNAGPFPGGGPTGQGASRRSPGPGAAEVPPFGAGGVRSAADGGEDRRGSPPAAN